MELTAAEQRYAEAKAHYRAAHVDPAVSDAECDRLWAAQEAAWLAVEQEQGL